MAFSARLSDQDLGIFQKFSSPILHAMQSFPLEDRHRVGKYIVLDLHSDPAFPFNGHFKKISFCVSEVFRGIYAVSVAAALDATCRYSQREVQVLQQLRGVPGIIDVDLIEQEDSTFWIFSRLFNCGDLVCYMQDPLYEPDSFTTHWIACCVASALAQCHARGIVLRDLKPDNILVNRLANRTIEIALTDFSFAFYIGRESAEEAIKGVGSMPYTAPEDLKELMRSNKTILPADFARDLWSFGTILYSLAMNDHVMKKIVAENGKITFRYMALPNSEKLGLFANEIRDLLSYVRNRRPTANAISERIVNLMILTYPEREEVQFLRQAFEIEMKSEKADVLFSPLDVSQGFCERLISLFCHCLYRT